MNTDIIVGILGLTEMTKPPSPAAKGDLWVRADAIEIYLGLEENFRPAKKAYPGIRVDAVLHAHAGMVHSFERTMAAI